MGEDNPLILWNLPRILNLDVLAYGCDCVRDYLRTNQEVQQRDTPDSTQGDSPEETLREQWDKDRQICGVKN